MLMRSPRSDVAIGNDKIEFYLTFHSFSLSHSDSLCRIQSFRLLSRITMISRDEMNFVSVALDCVR